MDAARGHGEYKINPSWNDELQELSSQHADIEDQIKDIYEDVRVACVRPWLKVGHSKPVLCQIMASWGSSLGVKCDRDPRRGVVLRTKRANDKKLRKQMGVTVVAVLKDGVRFTTSRLSQLGKDLLDVSAQYEEQQAELVAKAVEIARTYLPVIEASNAVLAELDAYNGYATQEMHTSMAFTLCCAQDGHGGCDGSEYVLQAHAIKTWGGRHGHCRSPPPCAGGSRRHDLYRKRLQVCRHGTLTVCLHCLNTVLSAGYTATPLVSI